MQLAPRIASSVNRDCIIAVDRQKNWPVPAVLEEFLWGVGRWGCDGSCRLYARVVSGDEGESGVAKRVDHFARSMAHYEPDVITR